MKRDFDEWLKSFKSNINGYDYYANFHKIIKNVELVKVELNILNSLIGSTDIESQFENIVQRYP